MRTFQPWGHVSRAERVARFALSRRVYETARLLDGASPPQRRESPAERARRAAEELERDSARLDAELERDARERLEAAARTGDTERLGLEASWYGERALALAALGDEAGCALRARLAARFARAALASGSRTPELSSPA